jgi:U3 small nucleolar RNA-associated protein 14
MKSKNTFTALLFLIMMSGNMVTAQVKSEYDKTVDFTKFKTFTFKGWQKDSDKQIDDIDKKRVEDAFKAELSSRGLTSDDDNPDLGITLYIVIEEKTSISSYDEYHGGLGYDAGRGWGLGYRGMGTGSANTTFE